MIVAGELTFPLTDLFSVCVELKELRNGRWDKAFQKEKESDPEAPPAPEQQIQGEKPRDSQNRKATIVIEHLIQAADVAHMSQHWNIYRKWNELLYREMYKAYMEGRSSTNPADGWYKGEIGFFDFYSKRLNLIFFCRRVVFKTPTDTKQPCIFLSSFSAVIPLSKKLSDCGVFGPTSGENLNNAQNNRNQWVREGEAIVRDMVERVRADYDDVADTAEEQLFGVEAEYDDISKEILAVEVTEGHVWEGSCQLPKSE